jgi:hypothetical protein
MALTSTTSSVQEPMCTAHPIGMRAVPWARRRMSQAVRAMSRRLLAAIIDGSDYPCWQATEAMTQLALLPPREQNRLLDSGRVTTRRG